MNKLYLLICSFILLIACQNQPSGSQTKEAVNQDSLNAKFLLNGKNTRYINEYGYLEFKKEKAKYYRVGYYKDDKPVTDSLFTEYYMLNDKKYCEKYLLSEIPEVIHGKIRFFYPNGNVKKEYYYNKGIIEGEYKEYSEDGKLTSLAHYKNGEKEGLQTTYYSNGKVAERCNYSRGYKNGKYEKFFNNGKVEAKGKYTYNHQVGIWNTYTCYGDHTVTDYGNGLSRPITVSYTQKYKPKRDPYNEGFSSGYQQGYEDRLSGHGYGFRQYDYADSDRASEEEYMRGYENGYESGYYECAP